MVDETGLDLDALRAGDRDAFARLVQRYHNYLLHVARNWIGNDQAEEAVQDGWIAAFRHLPNFEGRSSLKTWLTRIVINEARMRLRRGGREINLDLDADGQDALANRFKADGHWQQAPVSWAQHSPEQLLQEDDLKRCLQHHLAALPDNQRLLLELRDIQGLPFDDICNMLDISASNARVLLHRARATLFAMVERYQETGEC